MKVNKVLPVGSSARKSVFLSKLMAHSNAPEAEAPAEVPGEVAGEVPIEVPARTVGSKQKPGGTHRQPVHSEQTAEPEGGPSLRVLLPQMMNEQNRKTHGTWQNQFDFTKTIIGYFLGIHNFVRFPYLCYKFGGIFFIPYIVMMIFLGTPVVFMEFTIGQFYGVGSYIAFTNMAPILSCVSNMLTWNCVLNAWMFTVIMAWLRIYSSEAISCLKGWEVCDPTFFFNTPHCFTGALDDECNDPLLATLHDLTPNFVMNNDLIFYNFRCVAIGDYCTSHRWTLQPGTKRCVDTNGKEHTIYERRYHATQEFFYGAVLGLRRNMEDDRKKHLVEQSLLIGGFPTIEDLRQNVFNSFFLSKLKNKPSESETVRVYLRKIMKDPTQIQTYHDIMTSVVTPTHQDEYWSEHGRQLRTNEESSSEDILQKMSLTTWLVIGIFLFEDLLSSSVLSYVLNAVPMVILVYITGVAVTFQYADFGIKQLFIARHGFFQDLLNLEMWAEACTQVIYTSGIGNGVLISLSTFNNFDHRYLFDLYFTLACSIVCSCCGALICFCSIGQYLKIHSIDVPFWDYIKSESSTSSVEFCFIVYSHFLTLISDRNVVTILLFFMLNSFATDSLIHVVQNVLDAILALAPRLRSHPTLVLVALCLMGYLTNVPNMRNGSILLFIDLEYYTTRFIVPTIIMIQIGATVFVYKAPRLMDHAEQMGVFTSATFRYYMMIMMFGSFFIILGTVATNIITFKNSRERFNEEEEQSFSEIFGWVFYFCPLLMAFLSILKQLIVVPRRRWNWLLIPFQGKDRKVRRGFLRRMQGGRTDERTAEEITDQEQIRDATARWRVLESRLLVTMMEQRQEELLKKRQEAQLRKETEDVQSSNKEAAKAHQQPLLMALVRAAAAAKRAREVEEDGSGLTQTKEELKETEKKKSVVGDFKKLSTSAPKISLFSKLKAALTGKASKSGTYIPKRHIGGGGYSRIVTKISAEDGTQSMHFDHEDDQDSHETASIEKDVGAEEAAKLRYLNLMDYIERWPGRLDDSEIESEGSSVENESDEEKHHHQVP